MRCHRNIGGLAAGCRSAWFFAAACGLSAFLFLAACGCNAVATRQQATGLYVEAMALRDENRNEEAVEKLQSAIRSDKNFSLAYSLLGDIYADMAQYEKSAGYYQTATELNPWSFKDFFHLGRVYQVMREFTKALKAYGRAMELDPGHLQTQVNTARCYYQLQDYDKALGVASGAEAIGDSTGELQRLLGDIHESRKDYQRAIEYYKRSLESQGDNPEVMLALAVAYIRTGENVSARELLNSVVMLKPGDSQAFQYLGYVHLRLNDTEPALRSYGKAIAIDERNWEAHRGLGVAYMLKGIKENDQILKSKAVSEWRLSLAINPDQPRRKKLLELIKRYSEAEG